jgi:hypothetical protein
MLVAPAETTPAPRRPGLAGLPRHRLETMLAAGEEIAECYRVLRKAGLNVVGEVLKAQGQFIKLNHYPKGDVFDRESHAQYYYHAHRSGEHGHFHTFLRQPGMPPGVRPVQVSESRNGPKGEKALAHLVAISMDRYGYPVALFTTNRWVTGETWYRADDVCAMLERFAIDHAYPSWPVNRWLTAMICLFRPQIEALLHDRDVRLEAWAKGHPGGDVIEDRRLETISETKIDVDREIAAVREALKTS